jgi:effector-binding domain-containing protein
MEEEPGLIESLRRHWRALLIFTAVVATAAIVVEHRFFQGDADDDDVKVTPAAPAPPKAPGAAKPGDKAAETAKEPPAAAAPDSAAASVMSQSVTVDARPAAVLKGQGKWDGAAKTISAALAKLKDAVEKAGLAVNGRPIAVFTKTDDTGFSFEAMAPLAAAPEGKIKLAEGVAIGASPAGKALKFQHRGAYEEINATYEAIAAYLDEKGVDAKDLIAEEYLTDFKGEDDSVDVDIYVFLK